MRDVRSDSTGFIKVNFFSKYVLFQLILKNNWLMREWLLCSDMITEKNVSSICCWIMGNSPVKEGQWLEEIR